MVSFLTDFCDIGRKDSYVRKTYDGAICRQSSLDQIRKTNGGKIGANILWMIEKAKKREKWIEESWKILVKSTIFEDGK